MVAPRKKSSDNNRSELWEEAESLIQAKNSCNLSLIQAVLQNIVQHHLIKIQFDIQNIAVAGRKSNSVTFDRAVIYINASDSISGLVP